MVSVAEAQKIISEKINSAGAEEVSLTQGLGCVLAEDVYSQNDIPAFDNSAMDGYAVRSQDLAGDVPQEPVILEVVDDIPAGIIGKTEIKKGQAARIMTGAPVPPGADAVVMVEKTQADGSRRVRVFSAVKPGENIRRSGEDIKKGELALKKGQVIGPAQMGVLASLGRESVEVSRPPRVGILTTGDELLEVGEKLSPGRIRNSNAYSLFGQVKNAGAIPRDLGIARDDKQEIRKKIEIGLENDMLLISGGVSVGDYDYVKDVMQDLNGRIEFWKVAMRPGKPLVFGIIKGKPVFGLPGNPVSSMVSFELFVRPAIFKMLGRQEGSAKEVSAESEEEINKKKGFKYFLRAYTVWKDRAYHTQTTGPQGSGILKSMCLANSLIILPEDAEHIKKGETVTVRFLE